MTEEVGAPSRKSVPIREAVGLYVLELQEMYAGSVTERYARELTHFCRYAEGAGIAETGDLEVSHVRDFVTRFYVQERLFEQATTKRDVLGVTKQWLKWLKRRKMSDVYEEYRPVRRELKGIYKTGVRQQRKAGPGGPGTFGA